MAISAGYPRGWYALASFAGRFPRYLLVAYLGWQLQLSNRTIVLVLALTVVLGLGKALHHAYKRWIRPGDKADDDGH